MRRKEFTIHALLLAILVLVAFGAGIHFERERQRRADLLAQEMADRAERARQLATINQSYRRAATAAQVAQELLDAKLKESDELRAEIVKTREARDADWRRVREINEQIDSLKGRPHK